MPNANTDKGWIEDPTQLERVIESCKSEMTSDRYLSKFLLQLRFARPTNVAPTVGLTNASPAFMDGFLSIVKQIGYNQFLEVTDACTAKICQPLRPRVTPVAAKPDIDRMCTLLNRLIDGVLETCDFLAENTSAWEDSYCAPCGFVIFEIEEQTKEIRCHRGDCLASYWHRAEGRNPVHFYTQEPVSVDVLVERFPKFKDEITKAPAWQHEHILGVDPPTAGQPDTRCLSRGWRRKIGEQVGRYVVAVGRTVLNGDGQGEDWDYDFFPIAVTRSRWDHKGFGGIPVGRYIAPHHLAINRLARIAEDSFKGAVPMVMAHKDSKLQSISDIPYQVVKWDGSGPTPVVQSNNPVSQQVLARIDYHDAKSYAIAGINKSIAQGQAPKGVVAAVAMREVIELSDARANEYQKHWEASYRQAGHIIVAFANKLGKVQVKSTDANAELMEEIDTKSIKLDKNDYRISYGLSSALSKSISGLLSDLGDFKDLGFINRTQMAMAIGDKVPDLQSVMDGVSAHYRLAQKMVQTAIEKGEIPVPPSASQGQEGLDAILVLGQQAWCQAMISPDRYKPENKEALRRLTRIAAAKKGAPVPQMGAIQPGVPIPQNAIVPVGTPAAPAPLAPSSAPAPQAPPS